MKFIFQLFFTALALCFIVFKLNILESNPFKSISVEPIFLFVSLILYTVQIPIVAFRWQRILIAMGSMLPFKRVLAIVWAAQFWIALLPSGVAGDIYKVYKIDLSRRDSVLSVILDKLFAGLGVSFILIIFLHEIIQTYFPYHVSYLSMFLLKGLILSILIFLGAYIVFKLIMKLNWVKRYWRDINTYIRRVAQQLVNRNGIGILIIAFASQINQVFAIYFLARGLNIHAQVVDFFVAIPFVIIMSELPISFGGWGVREVVMILALAPYQVSQSQSLCLGVVMGLVAFLFSGLSGVSVAIPGLMKWIQKYKRPVIDN